MMFVKVHSKIHAFDLLWSTLGTGSHLLDCERQTHEIKTKLFG